MLRTAAFHKKNAQAQPEIHAIEAPCVKYQATEISKLKDTTFMPILKIKTN
jgi:hypothetical protein